LGFQAVNKTCLPATTYVYVRIIDWRSAIQGQSLEAERQYTTRYTDRVSRLIDASPPLPMKDNRARSDAGKCAIAFSMFAMAITLYEISPVSFGNWACDSSHIPFATCEDRIEQ
jgi:hypothetical protein